MVKDQILQTAMQHYETYGIKGVSMNEIANALHISKKTIYCIFRSKEEIITKSLLRKMESGNKDLDKVIRESPTALDALLRLGYEVGNILSRICPAFYKDLPRFPEANACYIRYQESMNNKIEDLFRQAVKEGYLLEDETYEVISKVFIEQLYLSSSHYKTKMMQTFFRGISTPKGIKIIEQYK